jgi:hypothetical protein
MQKISNNFLADAGATGKALLAAADAATAKVALSLATVATSGSYDDLTNKPTGGGVTFAKTKIVGVDGNTIQACINSVTSASGQNQTQILIPPGIYTENLTLKLGVSLAATGQNNGQASTVRIVGQHTLTGGATAGDNIIQFAGLRFDNTHATTPTFTFSATGGVALLVHFDSCMIGATNAATTAVGMLIGTDVSVRCNDTKSLANATAGSGGTHFDINGGALFGTNLSTEYGTRAILMRGTPTALKPYCELKHSDLRTTGANVVEIQSTTALFTAGWTGFENTNATGNGITLAGVTTAGAVAGVFNSVFTITAGASNYVVTGDLGSAYYSLNNSYSNATYAPYEIKIGANVAQFKYDESQFSVTNVYTLTTNPSGTATWVKPSGAKTVSIQMIGGGGGGASGAKSSNTAIARVGGGGGGGGGWCHVQISADVLSAAETVTIGQGGNGGAARTSEFTTGNGGAAGTASIFGPFRALGGNGAANNGGAGGGGQMANAGGSGSGTGSAGATGTPASATAAALPGGAGGGGGGGIVISGTTGTGGGAGGRSNWVNLAGGTGGSGTTSSAGGTGGAGNAVSDSRIFATGSGGAGGGGSLSGNGGNGGAGAFPGGAGGGGGATETGAQSGAGGNGAGGVVIVTTYF